ncbi:MAG: KH domain-containing protein [Dehalococcoidia bacterium]
MPETEMREMVEYVARALAANPDAVTVTQEDHGNRIVLRLAVDEKDKGKVIGRDGRVAQSLRSLLRVAAVKAGARVSLEID